MPKTKTVKKEAAVGYESDSSDGERSRSSLPPEKRIKKLESQVRTLKRYNALLLSENDRLVDDLEKKSRKAEKKRRNADKPPTEKQLKSRKEFSDHVTKAKLIYNVAKPNISWKEAMRLSYIQEEDGAATNMDQQDQ